MASLHLETFPTHAEVTKVNPDLNFVHQSSDSFAQIENAL